MIVLETGEHFKMTTQHDHAMFAGDIAKYFVKDLFIDDQYMDAALLAIREHDRAWIGLDQIPIWNDQKKIPFSFMDYPLLPKVLMYTKGIDEVEEINKYAGLLCSMHYSSFGHIRNSKQQDCINYMNNEVQRQKRLKNILNNPKEEMINQHFKLLQLCDEISLYVCLNNEGATATKSEEPWYKDGFKTMIDQRKYRAEWKSQNEIKLDPFPFTTEFEITFKTKYVSKDLRDEKGINSAYNDTSYTYSNLKIVR
jgi:hypothetical protein